MHTDIPIHDFSGIESDVMDIIAANLYESRKISGLSQSRMAKFLQVSLSQFKKYETGTDLLKIDTAMRWALCFSTPFYYLFRGSKFDLPNSTSETNLSFEWSTVNALSDEYFAKFIDLLCLFGNKTDQVNIEESMSMSEAAVKMALHELDNSIYISIAQGLRLFRENHCLNQDQTAEILNVSKATYQQYEKESMTPRISILLAARLYMATQKNPMFTLAETSYAKIRLAQDSRTFLLNGLVAKLSPVDLENLRPLIWGFFGTVRKTPGGLLVRY